MPTFSVVDQIHVLSSRKPNIVEEAETDDEEGEEIDTAQILDSFLTEED